MSLGKKKILSQGASAPAPTPFDPLQNFETVTYTGNGGTQKITGYIRKGAAFNNNSSRSVIDVNISLGSVKTISHFVRFNEFQADNIHIFSSSSNDLQLGIANLSNARTFFFYDGGTLRSFGSTAFPNDSNWHHLVWVLNGTSTSLYLDDSLVNTITTASATQSDIVIGSNSASSGVRGSIDQVRIFNKALSASEVTTLKDETYASSTKSTTDIFSDGSGVALYELDEGANDTGVPVDSGQSGVFNGSSSKITATSPTQGNTDASYSFWIKTDTVGNNKQVFGQISDSARNPFTIQWYDSTAAGKMTFTIWRCFSNQIWYQTGYLSDFDYDYVANTFYHIVLTYTASDKSVRNYVNGTQIGGAPTLSLLTTSTTGTQMSLGSYNDIASEFFDGSIDQVRIYSSALSSTDVTNLYNETSVPTPVSWYKLDGNADDSQGSNNGTATSVTYSTPASRQHNGTATNINYLGMAFQPDFVWIKNRDNSSANHYLIDSVRGIGTGGTYKFLSSDLTQQENTTTTNHVSSLDLNGFTVQGSHIRTNANTADYVAWCWRANGAAVSNTDGTITSDVSANVDAGFSIVKYTAGGAANVGHGLSQAPELIITKNLDVSEQWFVYAEPVGTQKFLGLNTTTAATSNSGVYTSVNSSTYTNNISSTSRTYINYCFHSVAGYQSVGSYEGNDSLTGPTVTTGFKPRFVLIKNIDSAGNSWAIIDGTRSTSNPRNKTLFPNSSASEYSNTGGLTFTDTGFEVDSTDNFINGLNNTHIYLAIA